MSRTRSSRPPTQMLNENRDLEAEGAEIRGQVSERATASAQVTVEDLFRRMRREADDLTARETRLARERHVVGGQYATALEMNKATWVEIDGLQQRDRVLDARETALDDRELMLYYRELFFQEREFALKQKQDRKKAIGFFSLRFRPGAASRASETQTISDRAYDGDVDTLTQSSNDAGSAPVTRAGQHAAGPSAGSPSSFRGNAASSPAFTRHYGSIPLDSFFNLHYRDGAEPLWIQQIDPFYTLPDSTYTPPRGRTVTSPRHDEQQALSATAAVFTPRAAQAALHDAGASSLEQAPVPSSSVSISTPASAGMVREADETAAEASEAEGASIYQDAQENVAAEEDQSVPSRDLRRVEGGRNLSASYKGKGKERSQD
jgi:hypothetical protein